MDNVRSLRVLVSRNIYNYVSLVIKVHRYTKKCHDFLCKKGVRIDSAVSDMASEMCLGKARASEDSALYTKRGQD